MLEKSLVETIPLEDQSPINRTYSAGRKSRSRSVDSEEEVVVVEVVVVVVAEPAAEVVEVKVKVKEISLNNGDFFCEAFFFSKASFSFSAESFFFKALFSDETLLISEESSFFEVS